MTHEEKLERLEKRRQEFNKAQREFQLEPSEATKAAYQVANSRFRRAKLALGLTGGEAPAPPLGEHPVVIAAREKCNEARRHMFAVPGPEAKKAWLSAQNELKRVRLVHDPEYRAKRNEANRKSKARKKLGLTGTGRTDLAG